MHVSAYRHLGTLDVIIASSLITFTVQCD